MKKLALIGFGEAGSAFATGWGKARDFEVCAFDINTDCHANDESAAKWVEYENLNVSGCCSVAHALQGSQVVLSLVTADQANVVARAVAKYIQTGDIFFDGNSCAPETKKKSALSIQGAGGHFIDMAIMAPVHPGLHQTPVLLSGADVKKAESVIKQLNLSAKIIEGPVGRASAIKMTRSIMMKGLEALMIECVLAGRKAGVADIVLDSLEVTYPGFEWKKRAAYMFERVMTHGIRRAAEMREVSITLDDLEIGGTMARASVDWHQRIGELGLDTNQLADADYGQLADLLLECEQIRVKK